MTEIEWRRDPPDSAGLWWCRPPDESNAQVTTVEYVEGRDRPFVIYHSSMTYRWLDDPHLTDKEWHGPVATRGPNGWNLTGFDPA